MYLCIWTGQTLDVGTGSYLPENSTYGNRTSVKTFDTDEHKLNHNMQRVLTLTKLY